MAKKPAVSILTPPDSYFVKELKGETPPSFATMKELYRLATDLYGLHPWRVINESQLVVIRDIKSGELCYCSVMGALGGVYSIHAYIGDQGLRMFRKIEAGEISDPQEFFTSMHSVSVEFVPKAELLPPDRQLLAALGHPQGRGVASPIFRAIRPGFHPWFITEDEARTLTECIRAVIIAVGLTVASQKNLQFWDSNETYPMVTLSEESASGYKIDLVKPILPPEPPAAPVTLPEETLRSISRQDYAVRGVMELDYIFAGMPVGEKNDRKACACLALAVDAATGIIYAPEVTDSAVPPGSALAKVLLKAIQTNRALPQEVRVRTQSLKDSLAPIMESFGVKLRVASQMPASDDARSHFLQFLM